MSTFKHPVGPQPNRVYWRRRLLVGLGALIVVIVVVLIVVRPGSSQGEPRAIPTSSTTPSAHPAVPPSTSIPTTSSTVKAQACDSSEVTVGAIANATSYAAGVFPNLSLSLTNTGSKPCKINAGTAQQVFTISSGSEVYWKSTDCQSNPTNAEVILQPGKTVTTQTPIVWDRTRSDPATCNATRTQVPAAGASNHLQTSVAGIVSKSTAQFSLN